MTTTYMNLKTESACDHTGISYENGKYKYRYDAPCIMDEKEFLDKESLFDFLKSRKLDSQTFWEGDVDFFFKEKKDDKEDFFQMLETSYSYENVIKR